MKEIVIDIEPSGKIVVEGKGFVGAECDKAMAGIEASLGEITRRELKPEFTQTRQTTNRVTR